MINNTKQGERVIVRCSRYAPISLIFPPDDNWKTSNTILDNLLTAYEKRIYTDKQTIQKEVNTYVKHQNKS